MTGWRPTPGPQETFLRSPAFEVLFGGAAGGGKSDALLAEAVRHVGQPRYRAIILRRAYPELERTLIPRSHQLLSGWARYNGTKHAWTFPSGAVLEFGYLDRDEDVHQYQGAEYQFVGWDELTTQPTDYPYRYLISRMRSTEGIPLRLRATSNPGGAGEAWVLKRFAPWLYRPGFYTDEYEGPYVDSDRVLRFVTVGEDEHQVDDDTIIECVDCGAEWRADARPPPKQSSCATDHPVSRTRQFIRSLLDDNPYLVADGEYAAGLQALDPLTYAQLRHGDWMIRPAAGLFFQKDWFILEPTAPQPTELEALVRYWDRAGTEARKGTDPDWTVGVLMGRHKKTRLVWVLDVVRVRAKPHDVQQLVKDTAEADKDTWQHVRTVLEQDPGQAGKFEVDDYARELHGYDVGTRRPTGDKVTRARPWSAHCKLGTVRLVKAKWNHAFIDEHVAFPDGANDDQVDGSSGAYAEVSAMRSLGRSRTRGRRASAARGGF